MIIGVGCDILEVPRIDRELKEKGSDFRDLVFTPKEIEYCEGKRYPAQHYAARFAAKESLFKAFSTGQRYGMSWREVEVRSGDAGQPQVILSGKVKEMAERLQVRKIFVSLSHTRELAAASIILES